jgi:hypothetical protein
VTYVEKKKWRNYKWYHLMSISENEISKGSIGWYLWTKLEYIIAKKLELLIFISFIVCLEYVVFVAFYWQIYVCKRNWRINIWRWINLFEFNDIFYFKKLMNSYEIFYLLPYVLSKKMNIIIFIRLFNGCKYYLIFHRCSFEMAEI